MSISIFGLQNLLVFPEEIHDTVSDVYAKGSPGCVLTNLGLLKDLDTTEHMSKLKAVVKLVTA